MKSLSRTIVVAVVACSALACALLSATPALANIGHGFSSSFGSKGTGPGELNEPSGVAVNDATGDVYVLDRGNTRVEYFSSTGTPAGEFNGGETPAKAFVFEDLGEESRSLSSGIAVDNSCYLRKLSEPECKKEDPSDGDVYVTDTGNRVVDKFEADGKYVSQIDEHSSYEHIQGAPTGIFTAIFGVSVDTDGTVLVSDAKKGFLGKIEVEEYSDALANRLIDPPLTIETIGGYAPGLAVGSEDSFYAMTLRSGVEKFNNNGEPVGKFGEPVGVDGKLYATGVAVDLANNDTYVGEGTSVDALEPDGTVSQEHAGLGHLNAGSGIGVDSADNVLFVVDGVGDDVIVLEIGPTPAAPETIAANEVKQKSAVLNGKLGSTQKYYFEYKQGAECEDGERTSVKEGDGEVSVEIAGLEPNAEYSYCTVTENQYGATRGPIESFTTQGEEPEILSEGAAMSPEGALLGEFFAEINPNNQETTYTFEYSTEADLETETLEGSVGIVGGAMIPAGFGPALAKGEVEVEPANVTRYYRVVATNATGTKIGKIQAYTKVPLVGNESFSELALTTAVLKATVNPVYQRSNYQFEYATSKTQLEERKGSLTDNTSVGSIELEENPVSTVITGLTPYTTYYYRVIAENASTKNPTNADKGEPVLGKIEMFSTRSLGLPTTGEALNVARTSVVLSGSVIAPFVPVTYYYEIISEAGYRAAIVKHASNPYAEGERTAAIDIQASESPQAAGPVQVGGLLPGTTYHYRLVVKNEFGWGYGTDLTFTTASKVLPVVSTGVASAISQNSATLSGTVTTSGLQTNYGFEIGTEPGSYGPATGLGSIGGSQTETVSVTLGELQPGTTYYYRVTASNADGTVPGQPVSFTTPGFPTLLTPQVSPPLIAFISPAFPAEEKGSGVSTKTLTKAQKLANALKACKKDKNKHKRASCEKQAHKKYGVATKKKK
jgi:NHL repeat-containing protein